MKSIRMVGLLIFEFTKSFAINRKGKIIKKMKCVKKNEIALEIAFRFKREHTYIDK